MTKAIPLQGMIFSYFKLALLGNQSETILKSNKSHTADSLTTGESDTWWQSQTMYSGDIEYPNNVTLTLDLHKVRQSRTGPE